MVMMSLTNFIFASFRNAKTYLSIKLLHGFNYTSFQIFKSFHLRRRQELHLQPHLFFEGFCSCENTELAILGNRQLKLCQDSQNLVLIVTPTTHFISST